MITVFSNSTTGYANEVYDNFIAIGHGDFLPMSNSGTMDNTTGVFELGSSTYKWNNVFVGVPTVSGLYAWEKIVDYTLTTTASTISISGINGDVDKEYRVFINITGRPSGVQAMYYNTSSSQYATHRIYTLCYESTGSYTTTGDNATTTTIHIGVSANLLRYEPEFSIIHISAETGKPRVATSEFMSARADYTHYCGYMSSVWTDTTSTITGLTFSLGGNADPNTHIVVFARGQY